MRDQIHIDHHSDVRDTHYNNLKNNIPNNGPDLAIIHSQLVKNYAVNDYIVPIDESFFTKETINPDDYQQNVMSTLIAGRKFLLRVPPRHSSDCSVLQ